MSMIANQSRTWGRGLLVVALAWGLVGCGGSEPPARVRTSRSTESPAPAESNGAETPADSGSQAEPAAEGWGDLTGRFVISGDPPQAPSVNVTKDAEFCGTHMLKEASLRVGSDGGVANVVVYVRSRDVTVNPELAESVPAEVTLDNRNCEFTPHVLAIWYEKQKLKVINSDPVGHNTNIQPLGDGGINPLLPANGEVIHAFNRRQGTPFPVTCNIHPWMTAYLLPTDNPYTAVSAEDGTFTIAQLPAGELEFQVWHEKPGNVNTSDWSNGRFTMTVKPGANDLGTITLDAGMFQ